MLVMEFRPEAELLCLACRTATEGAVEARIVELCGGSLDWKRVIRTAGDHQVLPTLYRTLAQRCPDLLPQPALQHLQHRYHANVAHNLLLTRELLAVRDLLTAGGVDAVPYKGPVLAVAAYGDVSLRQFGDLDFFIRPEDVLRARQVMEEGAFLAFPTLSPAQQRSFLRSDCEFWFAREAGELSVELHWAARERLYAFPLDIERMMARQVRVPLDGRPVPSLRAEDLLLVLAIHGLKHAWGRLKWICDVAELLRSHPGLDGGEVLDGARRLHGERLLLLCLRLARDLSDAPIPASIPAPFLDSPVLDRLVSQYRARLFQPRTGEPGKWTDAGQYAQVRERLRERLRFYLEMAVTPTMEDWESLPLPDPLFPLYHLIRPIRLTGKYGAQVGRSALSRLRPPVARKLESSASH